MTTFIQFTPALNSQVSSQLSGIQSTLSNNAILVQSPGNTGIAGQNSGIGVNDANAYINFTFQATLDSQPYNVIVTWSIYGQRYYVNLYDTAGVRIFTMPLIGSPNDYDISMTAGYFTSKLIYRESSQQFEVTP